MSNVLKENYKKLVDALAPYFGGASDFDDITNRPQESDAIDIDDLNLPMPAKPTEYPVLFDETGTEYQVGWYKRASDGKVKPVWRKEVGVGLTTTTFDIDISDCNVEQMLSYKYIYNISADANYTIISTGNCGFVSNGNNIGYHITNKHIYGQLDNTNNSRTLVGISIEYTKTSDEWKEV